MLGDTIREVKGDCYDGFSERTPSLSGPFYSYGYVGKGSSSSTPSDTDNAQPAFQISRVHPTSDEVRPITFCINAYIKAGTTYWRKTLRRSLVDLFYPIGSLWSSTIDPLQSDGRPCDPNLILGHGTWEIWKEAQGKTLVNIDRNDPEIAYTKMITGKKLHQLSLKEMPAHSHGIPIPEMQWPAIAKNQALSGYEVQGTQLTGATTDPAGESVPFSLMQPSISVVYWIRTD